MFRVRSAPGMQTRIRLGESLAEGPSGVFSGAAHLCWCLVLVQLPDVSSLPSSDCLCSIFICLSARMSGEPASFIFRFRSEVEDLGIKSQLEEGLRIR